jgi:hypothetical protein
MFYIRVFLILCVTFSTTHTWAWLDPVDFSADNGDELSTPKHNVKGYDRCDTGLGEYGVTPPLECHRWGLVWKAGSTTAVETNWKPGAVAEFYRLPTIKELVRLYDYTGGTGFDSNPVIKSYIDGMESALTGVEWLISSSYRDIDTKYDVNNNDRLQIFAINISTGVINTFEPGMKGDHVDPGTILDREDDDGLELCYSDTGNKSGLDSSGSCTLVTGHKVYQIIVNQTELSDL